MKQMKRILALLLVLAMAVAFSGCGKDPLIGTWVGEIDLSGKMVEGLDEAFEGQGAPSAAGYITALTLTLKVEFKDDGTYARSYDLSKDKDAFVSGCSSFMRDVIKAIAGKELDDATIASMLGMSLEDYAVTVLDAMTESMTDEEGTYENDGKNILWDKETDPYTIDGDTMKMDIEDIGEVFFTRVG